MEYRTTIDLTQLQRVCSLPTSLDIPNFPVLNSFRLEFKHGEHLDFYADTANEAQDWIGLFNTILDKMPDRPQWMGEEADDNYQQENLCFSYNVVEEKPKRGKLLATSFVNI
jgi:hypothetical protein